MLIRDGGYFYLPSKVAPPCGKRVNIRGPPVSKTHDSSRILGGFSLFKTSHIKWGVMNVFLYRPIAGSYKVQPDCNWHNIRAWGGKEVGHEENTYGGLYYSTPSWNIFAVIISEIWYERDIQQAWDRRGMRSERRRIQEMRHLVCCEADGWKGRGGSVWTVVKWYAIRPNCCKYDNRKLFT
jgi:hypothetical protein